MKFIIISCFITTILFASFFEKDKTGIENKVVKTIQSSDWIIVAEIHCIEDVAYIRDIKNNTFTLMYNNNSKPLKCEDIKTDDNTDKKDKKK